MVKTIKMVCHPLQGSRMQVEALMLEFERKVHLATRPESVELHGPVFTVHVGGLPYVCQAILIDVEPKEPRRPPQRPGSIVDARTELPRPQRAIAAVDKREV